MAQVVQDLMYFPTSYQRFGQEKYLCSTATIFSTLKHPTTQL